MAFRQCLLSKARLCCSTFIKCRVSRQQGWDLRGQSFLPADQLMDIKVSERPLPLKAMPFLTAEVLRALFPAARCSGDACQRPVLAHPKGSTVAIRRIRFYSQTQCWARGHHRHVAPLARWLRRAGQGPPARAEPEELASLKNCNLLQCFSLTIWHHAVAVSGLCEKCE